MLFKSKQLVGLDIGSTSVKIVGLKPGKKNEYELQHLGLENLAPDTIVDGAIMAKLPSSFDLSRILLSGLVRRTIIFENIIKILSVNFFGSATVFITDFRT